MPRRPGEAFKKQNNKNKSISNKIYNRFKRDNELAAMYKTKRWQSLRLYKLTLNPLCELCEAKGLVVPAEVVHHKKEAKESPELFFCIDNLQSLCSSCHNKVHGGEQKKVS